MTRELHQATMTRRQLLGGAAVGLAAAGLDRSGARAEDSLTLALDWYPNANHAGIYLAQDRGWFAERDLALDVYTPSDPTVVLQTVGAERDDLGISYQTDVLLARAEGVPVVTIAALVQRPLVTIMTLESANIRTPADLEGKTIGYPGIPSQAAFLATMLEGAGLSMDDVTLVNIGFGLLPSLISGRVDASLGSYWTHETIVAELQGYPVHAMHVEEWGVPEYYELVLVTNERTLAEREELLRDTLTVLQQGYAAAADDPDAALEALATAYPELDPRVEAHALSLLPDVWFVDDLPFGHQSVERWRSYAAWMQSRDLIPADLDIDAAYRTDLLVD